MKAGNFRVYLAIMAAALIVSLMGCATAAPPRIAIENPDTTYISPANMDGIKDSFTLPVSLIPDARNVIIGYSITVSDASGNRVRSIEKVIADKKLSLLENLLLDLRLRKRAGVEAPALVIWDGTDDSGRFVADGSYKLVIEAWDKRNRVSTPVFAIIVDNTPPLASLGSTNLMFSPNGDGNRDTFFMTLDCSEEYSWKGSMLDSKGALVFSNTWEGKPPVVFEWNGKDAGGKTVADGLYNYRLRGEDLAGNVFEAGLANIAVNTAQVPFFVGLSGQAFSPNGDGIRDVLFVQPVMDSLAGTVGWSLDVLDESGMVIYSQATGTFKPLPWNGRTTSGSASPDGKYRMRVTVEFANGNRPVQVSGPVLLDTTVPKAVVESNLMVFSPDGDGIKDTIRFSVKDASTESLWQARILLEADGWVVLTKSWVGKPSDFEWDGRDENGNLASDGYYIYQLSSVDEAGNMFATPARRFILDTKATPVAMRVDSPNFSPNGDGVKDTASFELFLPEKERISSWKFSILDARGAVVKLVSGKNSAPPLEIYSWDGRNTAGILLPEGAYTAKFDVEYEKGNISSSSTGPFILDVTPPKAVVTANATAFSPDGDKKKDTIRFTVTEASLETAWRATVTAVPEDRVVYNLSWAGKPADFEWNGRDRFGNLAPNGTYSYQLHSSDEAGNSFTSAPVTFILDIRETPISIRVGSSGFSPNGDGFKDTIAFDLNLPVKDLVASWNLSFIDARGVIARQESGKGGPPAFDTYTWDGRTSTGAFAPEGLYTAKFEAEYEKGNLASVATVAFALDVTPPQVELGFLPLPFSPDDDGINDTLDISMKILDQSQVSDWELVIRDREGNFFNRFSGIGTPPVSLSWNGLSHGGELVLSAEDYPVEAIVRDIYGNVSRSASSIPVDILVIKEGDRYRIRVPGIYFSPFTSEFPADKLAANMKTLKRLSEVLAKYPTYSIRIEGNAVRINWANKALGDAEERDVLGPLSLSRAEKVKSILVSFGMEAGRMTTSGLGGTLPLVPHNDLDNRWKNRRVDFLLTRR
jgi:flagellar hook assembly protein FlgD